jgi:DNA mismatch endonuclease (patch repair protein)
MPKTNIEFWRAKFAANVERDARKKEGLLALGYDVAVLWECETVYAERLCKRVGRLFSKCETRSDQDERPQKG